MSDAKRETAPAGGAAALDERILDCVHCGLCLDACPTYLELGKEPDSPRGRILLMRAHGEGRLEWTEVAMGHIDLCLNCRACESACPSGVQYGLLVEETRAHLEAVRRRTRGQRLQRAVVRGLFPHARRMGLALAPVRLFQALVPAPPPAVPGLAGRGIAAAEALPGWVLRLLPPGLRGPARYLPRLAPARRLPARVPPATGRARARVGLLTGCVMSAVFPQVNAATARVLARAGLEVVIPRAQGCCGALGVHTGDPGQGRRFARRLIDTFEAAGVDFVAVNAAGCGSTMKEYGHLLADDLAYAERAGAFARKVRDVSELLCEFPLPSLPHPVPVRAAYHDACHLAHGQGIRAEPRRLLESIPGLELVPLEESEVCCGSAGVYNLLQPEMAGRLARRKTGHLRAAGAPVVVTGNPGCALQIRLGLLDAGLFGVAVFHPVELLDAAAGAPEG